MDQPSSGHSRTMAGKLQINADKINREWTRIRIRKMDPGISENKD
jgi:hypothetical protein